MKIQTLVVIMAVVALGLLQPLVTITRAADHGEPPAHAKNMPNNPWNIADFFAFRNPNHPDQLVFVITTVGPMQGTLEFPPEPLTPFGDGTFTINVDNNQSNMNDGEVVDPALILAKKSIQIIWDKSQDENPKIISVVPITAFFAGLRDDPFIITTGHKMSQNQWFENVPGSIVDVHQTGRF